MCSLGLWRRGLAVPVVLLCLPVASEGVVGLLAVVHVDEEDGAQWWAAFAPAFVDHIDVEPDLVVDVPAVACVEGEGACSLLEVDVDPALLHVASSLVLMAV